MGVKIENPRYHFSENNIMSVSGDLVIYSDDNNTNEVFRKGLFVRGNLSSVNADSGGNLERRTNAENALVQQAQYIIAKYNDMMQVAKSMWPDATTPEEALEAFVSGVEAKITA